MTDRNPQSSQMADESMLRTLSAQVRCIWPQEQRLFQRYGNPQRILDVGCGTGEFLVQLAKYYPNADIVGIEINPEHVERAIQKCSGFGSRVNIEQGDAFDLNIRENSIDLVVCRHVLQAVPQPKQIVSQCQRVLKKGGWIHLLIEDYTMIHIDGSPEFDRFWLNGPVRFGLDTDCDLRIGRRGISLLHDFAERKMDFIVVDTERVAREDFIDIFTAWRDGYSDVLAPYLGWSVEDVTAMWNNMLEALQNTYAVWQVPIVSGRRK